MVSGTGFTAAKLRDVARDYIRTSGLDQHDFDVAEGSGLFLLDEGFCRDVAAVFDAAPLLDFDTELAEQYLIFKSENLRQLAALTEAGLRVRPWRQPGQPYATSRELRESVLHTGTLYVYMTMSGHGPGEVTGFHPLRAPSGVRADGVDFTHNDVFRAVHDVFGHVAEDVDFGPRGEFIATKSHLRMYPDEVLPVLFTEQIGQICWFFFGPHLADSTGRLPRPGEPGYLPPARRPYPPQKVFPYPVGILSRFRELVGHQPARSPE
ncbi:hypothetical protein ALI144C_37365 [Actinosynnema sp. ALI-1.44]|nr:hypothetical protein ALI144C_37365 [Actinosynnema sp. ALI-1.44]